MGLRLFWAAVAVVLVLPAPLLAATYNYTSQPMRLVPAQGGYSLNGEPIDLPAEKTQAISFWVDPGFLRNRLANTRITASIEPWSGETSAVAIRDGKVIARQDDSSATWLAISGPVDSFGASFRVTLNARSDVESWSYSTDGETTSLSLGGARDSLIEGTASDWRPQPPEWISDGPGTWVHSPVPVPVPASLVLLLSALGPLAALRSFAGTRRRA
jgi:hypothetical protein